MYSVQNLTSKPVTFQGVVIAPYGSATFPVFNDYITLAQLSNSGKIRYCQIPSKTATPVKKEEVKAVEVVETVEKVEEVVTEPEKIEEPVTDEVVETTVETGSAKLFDIEPKTEVDETPVVEEVVETAPKKRRSKKNSDE